ncbi:Phosphorylated carbohydrates phosphatase [Paenibacillus plantiphilus]|uniref:Phosphorylated carbohydrates phosphatase n=1 Tax=Paenibacillus plantiphilus TaxID=2905650 RepID=A0ABN8GP13_9BACL|nr:HAD family phosphatase [Paenibacillus plantiphilus]CAH1208083.1 Phosphorylated carbohydrates phosphatase [Paenibacillus plantiphilus]
MVRVERFEPRAVIFDMDGVLVDSEPLYFEIEKRSFASHGFSLNEEEHHAYVGIPLRTMWEQLRGKYGLELSVDELLANHEGQILVSIADEVSLSPIEGVVSLIHSLREAGIAIGLASSSSLALIDTILTKVGLKSDFQVVVSGEQVRHGKPSPDIFLRAAELLGVAPSDCLVIEDSHHGVTAAKAAGMTCVGYYNPNSGKQDLSHADRVIASYEEIIDKGIEI